MLRIVSGPPCAGKSTYVAVHIAPGDIVIDLDALAQALGSPGTHEHPDHIRALAQDVRRGLIGGALRGLHTHDVWIIDTTPTPEDAEEYRRAGAQRILVDPGEEICHTRADKDRPKATHDVIFRWYRDHELRTLLEDASPAVRTMTRKRGRK